MQNCIKSLQDPYKVASIQQYFGVSYNKKVNPKLLPNDECAPEENMASKEMPVQRKHSSISSPELIYKAVQEKAFSGKTSNQMEMGIANNLQSMEENKNYSIRKKCWYYLFFFGTYLGDVAGYGFLLPFLIWNIDAVIGRKLVLVWTVVMYIGQALKEILCVERPACPPVIRLQKKWSKEYGMPSTHAMASIALSSSVIYYGIRRYNFSCGIGIAIAAVFCILISFSRLYLGMHSILDVLVGFLLSSLLLIPFLPLMDFVGGALVYYYWAPVIIIALSFILILIYPNPHGSLQTSRDDTICILATCVGIEIGSFCNYQLFSMKLKPTEFPLDITLPNGNWIGMASVRIILGLLCLVTSFIVFEFLVKVTHFALIRTKMTTNDLNNSKGCISIVDLSFKYLKKKAGISFWCQMRSRLLSATTLSAVGIGGYLLGQLHEKLKWEHYWDRVFTFKHLPALPLFGTVSAAMPAPIERNLAEVADSASKADRTSQIMKYGFPGLDNVRSYQDFVLSYDQRNRVAHWVFEHLSRNSIVKNKNVDRSKCEFREDKSIHSFFRAVNQDYKGSGYDRGHLAAAGNHRFCQEYVNETFLLTNIAPQVGLGFNRDVWNDLEKYVRKLARINQNVYVCTGPLYLPRKEKNGKTYVKYEVIGPNHVAVPTHFFKVVVIENDANDLEMEAYVMPNEVIENGTPLHLFQVPVESIERASGLLFFSRISKNRLKRINNTKLT